MRTMSELFTKKYLKRKMRKILKRIGCKQEVLEIEPFPPYSFIVVSSHGAGLQSFLYFLYLLNAPAAG